MSLIRAYREDYFFKINSRTCTVIRDIRVRCHWKKRLWKQPCFAQKSTLFDVQLTCEKMFKLVLAQPDDWFLLHKGQKKHQYIFQPQCFGYRWQKVSGIRFLVKFRLASSNCCHGQSLVFTRKSCIGIRNLWKASCFKDQEWLRKMHYRQHTKLKRQET